MKHLITFVLLLVALTSFAQSEKTRQTIKKRKLMLKTKK